MDTHIFASLTRCSSSSSPAKVGNLERREHLEAMRVSTKNSGFYPPKSSILIGFSIILGEHGLFLETSRYFEDCMFCVCLSKIYQS